MCSILHIVLCRGNLPEHPPASVAVGQLGPGLLIGRATTRGVHQRSKQLSPSVKWSYQKLILWWVLVFLSIGWIIFYTNTITRNSSAVLSLPLTLFSALSAIALLPLLVVWRHNQYAYKIGFPSGNARSSANAVAL